jgi:hypothetical protein
MVERVIPSLSEDGWVDGPIKKADYMFSHFFLAEYSQTYMFNNRVASFPWIMKEGQGNINSLIQITQQTLANYFSAYFNDVIVEVQESPNETGSSRAAISVFVQFKDDKGNTYSLGKLARYSDMKVEEIINLNNFGTTK